MADKPIGKVSHYYDKIGVAVIDLLSTLKLGQTIKISGHDQEFSQEVSSMQMEHEKLEEAKKGQSVGLKVDKPVKEGDEVYLVK